MVLQIAGGEGISVMLPKWSPDDKLLYIHDTTNWWNLYKLDDQDNEINVYPKDQEIGGPAWEFGGSPYSCNPDGNGEMLLICGPVWFVLSEIIVINSLPLPVIYGSTSVWMPRVKKKTLWLGSKP